MDDLKERQTLKFSTDENDIAFPTPSCLSMESASSSPGSTGFSHLPVDD